MNRCVLGRLQAAAVGLLVLAVLQHMPQQAATTVVTATEQLAAAAARQGQAATLHQQDARRHQQQATTKPESDSTTTPNASLPFMTASEYQTFVRGGRKLLLPQLHLHTWMGHIVPERERHMGMVYAGDWSRLRAALARRHATGKLVINIVGGSISAGAGAVTAHSWVEHLEDWIALQYNGTHDHIPGHPPMGDPRVRVTNGAVPGTFSSYMSVCYSKHVPKDVDIVLVEYALNDEHAMMFAPSPDYVQRAFERLLRKLLAFPNKPAVILLNAYTWFQWGGLSSKRYNGMFNSGSDAMYLDLAMYYQLPLLSIKACCYHLMLQGVPGFVVSRTRGNASGQSEVAELDASMKDTLFFWDRMHPNGETGHRAMADLAIDLLHHAEKRLKRRPWNKEAQRIAKLKIPPPMLRNNWESPSDKCFIGDTLQGILDPSSDFKWANDLPPNKRPKWGYIADQPGATMRVKIDTRQPARMLNPKAVSAVPGATPGGKAPTVQSQGDTQSLVAVEVAHLKSYNGMGTAEVTCMSGCMCNPSHLNTSIENQVSLVALHEVMVTQSEACVIQIQITGPGLPPGMPGSGSKVKITGVMVSDEPGPSQLPTFTALDFVSTGMSNQTGTFDISNTLVLEEQQT